MGQLAEQAGISTSLLYKFQSGTRLPDSVDTLERLLNVMACSLPTRTELCRAYHLVRIGEDRYAAFQLLKQMLGEMADRPALSDVPDMVNRVPILPGTITGVRNVNDAVYSLMLRESRRDGGQIDLLVPPRYTFSMDCLNQLLPRCAPGFLEARHLFCMQAAGRSESQRYNMSIIRQVLPRMMNLERYEPYYGYLPDPDDGTVPFPFCIITSDGVLLLDGDLQSAVFLWDQDVRQMYKRSFERIMRRFQRVRKTISGGIQVYLELSGRLLDHAKTPLRVVSLTAAPTVVTCLRPEAAMAYLPPDVLASAEDMAIIHTLQENAATVGHATFFTLTGLRDLLTTGRISEMVGKNIPRLRREDALDAVEEMLRRAKRGIMEPYLFREDIFQGDRRCGMGLYGSKLLTCCETTQDRGLYLDVTESTLTRVVQEYTDNALLLGDVYPIDQTIEIVEHELRAFCQAEP